MGLKNIAHYRRYLLKEFNLLAVRGNIAPVLEGMHDYNMRHRIPSPPEAMETQIRDLLAAAVLSALSLSERESWGWSMTFNGIPFGFFAGVEPEGMAVLRAYDAAPQKASAMVQRQKAGLPLVQSHIQPGTQSPRDAVEQYFVEAAQTWTRIAVADDGDGILIQALPGGRSQDLGAWGDGELLQRVDAAVAASRVRELGEALVFYECRCSEEMIARLIRSMNAIDRRDMFDGAQTVEVECPRCGRKYQISESCGTVH